jgi:SAM-dependent methyltransferase
MGRRVTQLEQEAAFSWDTHPYNILAARVRASVTPTSTILDIGCGRDAVRLRRFVADAGRGYGVDIDEFTADALADERVSLHRVDGDTWSVPSRSIDVAYSVSVFEHLERPAEVVAELRRVMRPGGHVHILTPNRWDYVSLAASLIPNALHPWMVARTEGRKAADTFPTYFRANTRTRLAQLARDGGFEVRSIEYRGWAPTYLAFDHRAFAVGAAYQRLIQKSVATQWLQGWLLASLLMPVAVTTVSEPAADVRQPSSAS